MKTKMRTLACLLTGVMAVLAACSRAVPQQSFDSPEAAAQALVAAARTGGTGGLLVVLGNDAEPLVDSGDPVQDGNALEKFVAEFDAVHAFEESDADRTVLVVGEDRWPFPFPLVRSGGQWRFDSTQGADEIVSRRVGANELATIQSCLAFVDAQREYYSRNPENAPLLHYAQRLVSGPDKKDGLYWPTSEGEPDSPLGEGFAKARSEGYLKDDTPGDSAYHGYLFKQLTSQGSHATGGAYDYMTHGELLGGFALLAVPAEYGNSGVMTFMVSHDGIVYSKDLGPKTTELAAAIKVFDPDSGWKKEASAN